VSRLAVHHRYSFVDYVELEQASNVKHEFFKGEIYAMAGGTPDHAALCLAFGAELRARVASPCRAFGSELRIRVLATGLATYPDACVVCGPLERDPASHVTVTNPVVVVEVLSPSTEPYDRGAKFEHYKMLPSLQEYVLVSSQEPLVEVRRRGEADEWESEESRTGGTVRLRSLGCEIPVDEVYRDVLKDLPA
jgi:Uma2 family endonuclease